MIHSLELERRTRTKIESDVALNVAIDVTAKAVNSAAPLCRVVPLKRVATESPNQQSQSVPG